MWILFILLLGVPASAEDLSGLYFRAHSYGADGALSTATYVHVMLKDPLGRETGDNPFTGESFANIPNAGYDIDSVTDEETGQPGPESIEFDVIPAVNSGEYLLYVFGVASGKYGISLEARNSIGTSVVDTKCDGYSIVGTTTLYTLKYDPTPGAPKPEIKKVLTFDVLRSDVIVAQKLVQLGEDKFANSLLRQLSQAEKLNAMCEKRRGHEKAKGCEPAASVLKLFVKRLELSNKKCDKPEACDEERPWTAFRKEHGSDHDYDDFFRDWDRDDWHKWKNKSKRFVTDEALGIIKGDAEILLQDLAGAVEHDGEKGKDKKR